MKRKSKIFDLSAISIIACDCLQAVICIFVDFFLVANILKDVSFGQSVSDNIFIVGLFYIIFYSMLGLSYTYTGYFLKNHNKSILVSAGSIVLTVVVLVIYLLGNNLYTWLPLVAFFHGLGFGWFSSGFNNLVSETISSKHQVRFFAVKKIAFQATYIIFPISIGFIVEYANFSIMALIMIALCVLLVVFSFLIKPKKVYKLSFNLPKFYRYIKRNKQSTEPLRLVYLNNFFRGASYDCFTTLITILVWITLQSNSSLGTLQSIFTLCSLATMFLYLRYYRKKRARSFIIPTIVLVSATVVGIICTLGTSIIAIVIFYAVYIILNVILMSISDSRRAGVVRILSLHSHILESTAFNEFALASGRVLSSVLLMLSGLFDSLVGGNSTTFLLIVLAIVCVFYIFYGLSLYWIERSLIRQDEQFHKVHVNELFDKVED